MSEPLKVCFAASELAPLAKTGGLADVGWALPRELQRAGHDLRVFVPLYGTIDRAAHRLQVVDFVRDVELGAGPHGPRFTLWTTRLAGSDVDIYLVDAPGLIDRPSLYTTDWDEPLRFGLFSRAVIESCQRMGFSPHVFHCNDWHTALIPLLLRTLYDWDTLFQRSRTVLTIHNIGYQGVCEAGMIEQLGLGGWSHLFDQQDLDAGRLNCLRTGLLYADAVTTVSPTYAREIQTEGYGHGLHELLRSRSDRLIGILNGVDYDEWDPANDPFVPHSFTRDDLRGKRSNKKVLLGEMGQTADLESPLLGIVSRLAYQKGFDLCFDVLPAALARTDLRLAVVGTGEARYEEFFERLAQRFPAQVAYHRGYSEQLAHLVEAGADMFLMPSRYEPCGLNQMFSMRYGTIPVVRRTGGLADTVRLFDESSGEGTGFVFEHFTAEGLTWALSYALSVWRRPRRWRQLVRNAMSEDFSWESQARRYVELYAALGGGQRYHRT